MKDFSLNQAFVNLRNRIQKSQGQFAALIGCSRDAVISVENRRNGVSGEMLERIRVATGAELKPQGKVQNNGWHGKGAYTKEDFERWVKLYDGEEAAKMLYQRSCDWLQVLFEAASQPGFAGLKNRMPVLHLSLCQWMERVKEDFDLGKQVDEILLSRTVTDEYVDDLSEEGYEPIRLKSTYRMHWHPANPMGEFRRDWKYDDKKKTPPLSEMRQEKKISPWLNIVKRGTLSKSEAATPAQAEQKSRTKRKQR